MNGTMNQVQTPEHEKKHPNEEQFAEHQVLEVCAGSLSFE